MKKIRKGKNIEQLTQNKGFTLVELLAVITILGVVMLIAAIGVLPMIDSSRQKSLLNEGRSLVEAAKLAYVKENQLRGKSPVVVSLDVLNEWGYYDKSAKDDYVGSVKIVKNGANVDYNFWITDGNYGYANVSEKAEEPKALNVTYDKWANILPYNSAGASMNNNPGDWAGSFNPNYRRETKLKDNITYWVSWTQLNEKIVAKHGNIASK